MALKNFLADSIRWRITGYGSAKSKREGVRDKRAPPPAFSVFRDPMIQKTHLLLCVEPMLATRHDRQLRTDPFSEGRYGLQRGQIVPLSVQNTCGDAPRNRMLPHIAEIPPRQRFSERCGDLLLFRKLPLCDACPQHHIADQLIHVHHGRNEKRLIHQRFIQRGQREERTDAVGNQGKAAAALAQSGKKGGNSSLASHGA